MTRPTFQEVYMQVAYSVAQRATCPDRKVGCVLTDANHNILSTGYNGVPSGTTHCTTTPCAARKTGGCYAVHAEQNALLKCPDVSKIEYCYTTTSPCITCAKLLANTACRIIIFNEEKHFNDEITSFWLSTREDRKIMHINRILL